MTWEDSWREHRTGWDAGATSPALKSLVDQGSLPGGRALVPGCGSGYDAFALAQTGLQVTGLDIAPSAAKRFCMLRAEHGLDETQADIEVGDYFTFDPPEAFALIWDYTFLCAIQPHQREEWAEKTASLLAPNGELITLIFPIQAIRENDAGPPFQITPALVQELLAPYFEQTYLEPVLESHPNRGGLEWLGRWRKR